MRYSPGESQEWILRRLEELGLDTFDALAGKTNIDRGTLSRYFRQERRPSIDAIEPLCKALKVSPEKLLQVLGALDK